METYENYPMWIVVLSNLFGLSIYVVGALVLMGFGGLYALLYLLYCLFIEVSVMKRSCVDCYHYGKSCAFGKGRICSFLFKRGDPKSFAEKEISFSKMIPDFMVVVFPLVGGLILLVLDFSWSIVLLLTVLVVLFSAGNAIVRGSLACKHCKQRELGCPAEKFFSKKIE